jgi:hypothetical protein
MVRHGSSWFVMVRHGSSWFVMVRNEKKSQEAVGRLKRREFVEEAT